MGQFCRSFEFYYLDIELKQYENFNFNQKYQ